MNIWRLAVLMFLSGCLRVGLPEHVALTAVESRVSILAAGRELNTILIVPPEVAPDRSIGVQFVLLIFPLSRVYLQSGAQRLAAEVLAEEFGARGVNALETDSLQQALALYRATPSIKRIVLLQTGSFSASAYDLFFTRRASVSGALKLSVISPEDGSTVFAETLEVSEAEFRSTAYGPALTNMLERGIRKAFKQNKISAFEAPRRKPGVSNQAEVPTCIIPLPEITTALSPTLGAEVALAYGFKQLKPLQPGQLARLVQRGILHATEKLGIACGATIGSSSTANSDADLLRVSFSELGISSFNGRDAGEVMSAKVSSNVNPKAAPIEINVPVRSDIDGARAFALVELGEKAVTALNFGLAETPILK